MIGRRALLGGLMSFGGIPPRRPDQHIPQGQPGMMPPPQQNIVIGRFVIVAGTKGGLFVYSGQPKIGTNNLILSIAPTAGTDPYGNPYREGLTDYSPSQGTNVQLDGAQISFNNGALAIFPDPGFPTYLDVPNLSVGGGPQTNDQVAVTGSISTTLSLFMANRAADPVTPVGGGRIYCKAGALFYKGTSGTVTQIAPA